MNDGNTAKSSINLLLDQTVNELESHLLPEMETNGIVLKKQFPRFIFETASRRVADGIHAFGLSCRPENSTSWEDRISMHVNVFGINETNGVSFRGFVGWSDSYVDRAGFCHRYYEAMTQSYRNATRQNLQGFYREIPKLYSGLRRALKRGRPPRCLERFWSRLTRRCD